MSEYTEKTSHQVHQALIEMRMRQGITQEEMAERMHCSVDTVSRFEREQAGADCLSKCIAYQEALGIRTRFSPGDTVDVSLMQAAEIESMLAIHEMDADEMPVCLVLKLHIPTVLSNGMDAVIYAVCLPAYNSEELERFRIGCVIQNGDNDPGKTIGYITGFATTTRYANDAASRRKFVWYLDSETEELGQEGIILEDYLKRHPNIEDQLDTDDALKPDILFIDEIYVEPEYRKNGVLSAMRTGLNAAFGENRITLLNMFPFEYIVKEESRKRIYPDNLYPDFTRNKSIATHYGYMLKAGPEEDQRSAKYYAVKNLELLGNSYLSEN